MSSALGRLNFFAVCVALIGANIGALQGGHWWLVLVGVAVGATCLTSLRDPSDAASPPLFVGSLTLVLGGVWFYYGALAGTQDPRQLDSLLIGSAETVTGGALWGFARMSAHPGQLMTLPFTVREREGVFAIVLTPEALEAPHRGWAIILLENGWTGARRVEALIDNRVVGECTLGSRELGALSFELQAVTPFKHGVFASLRLRVNGYAGRRWAFVRGVTDGTTDPRVTTIESVGTALAGNAVTDLLEARDADLLHLTFATDERGVGVHGPRAGYESIEDVEAWLDRQPWRAMVKEV